MSGLIPREVIARLKEVPIIDLASDLGLDFTRSGSQVVGLCPFHSERTPSFYVQPELNLFRCHGCEAGGTVIDLVKHVRGVGFIDAAKYLAERAGVDLGGGASVPAPPRRANAPRAKREHLPREVIDQIARACAPVTSDEVVSAYLRGRKIDPSIVAHLRMFFALRADAEHYWARSGHRLICPMYDRQGIRRSVIGRRVEGEHPAKTISLRGATSSGLLLACPGGIRLLRGEALDVAPGEQPTVVIAEGEIDAATFRCHTDATAVLGVRSGAWNAELAARVPDGARVVIATDGDEAGERYATRIVETFAARGRSGKLEVLRWAP